MGGKTVVEFFVIVFGFLVITYKCIKNICSSVIYLKLFFVLIVAVPTVNISRGLAVRYELEFFRSTDSILFFCTEIDKMFFR